MRTDVEFPSCGQRCRGWLYRPDPRVEGSAPAVVMAHGFSAVKEMFLPAFAERFAAAGLVTLVFDYRFLGASDGEPRGQIFPEEQREDYRNALSWLAQQPGVDPERLGIWGTSFSGGHVLQLAAFERRVKAAVAQVPLINAWKQVLTSGGRDALHALLGVLAFDRAGRFLTGALNTLPVVAPPGQPCVLSTPDAWEWFEKTGAERAPSWQNAVTMESLERMVEYHPADAIELVSPTPLLVIAAEHDSLISIELVRAAFARAGDPKQLLALGCGHFDVYASDPWFEHASRAATDWFTRHLARA